MLVFFACSLVLSTEVNGVTGINGQFIPLVSTPEVDGRGLFTDFDDNKVLIDRYYRFVASFQITSEFDYSLQSIFGYTRFLNDLDHKINITTFGTGGYISKEVQASYLYLCEMTEDISPGKAILEIWSKLTRNDDTNVSALLFNETVEFY